MIMTLIKKPLTRRDFIRGTVGTALGATLFKGHWLKGGTAPASTSLVTIVRDQNAMDQSLSVDKTVLKKMLEQTLLEFTGKSSTKEAWFSLIKPDDKIGLVPTPHLNPTHDEVVEAVRTSLMEAGIPENRIMSAQGAIDKPDACTALIPMPALKAHWLTGIGTVLKDYILYSGRPRDYHGENNAKLGEIWNYPEVKGKTKLVLVDALYPLCDKGPQPDPRYKWSYNGLIAGTDPVAVESVCLKIIMEKRASLRGEPWPLSPPPLCIEAADKVYGLGTSQWENIQIKTYGWDQDLMIG